MMECKHKSLVKCNLEWFGKVYPSLCYNCIVALRYQLMREDIEKCRANHVPYSRQELIDLEHAHKQFRREISLVYFGK